MFEYAPFDGLSRRDALKLAAAGVSAVSLSGWLDVLARARRPASHQDTSRCILLWMDGGPSHKDTFDLKPGTEDGGEFKPIATSVPGIQISEHFPKFAKLMKHAAILRGMTTGEGAHGRAKYYMHTGYREGQGGLVYPSLGSHRRRRSWADAEFAAAELRHRRQPQPTAPASSAPRYQPLDRQRPDARRREPQAAGRRRRSSTTASACWRRWRRRSTATTRPTPAPAHQTTYQRAVTLMQSKEAKAFDLSQEPAAVAQGLRRAASSARAACWPAGWSRRASLRRGRPRRLGHAPEQLRPRQEPVAAGRSGHVSASSPT